MLASDSGLYQTSPKLRTVSICKETCVPPLLWTGPDVVQKGTAFENQYRGLAVEEDPCVQDDVILAWVGLHGKESIGRNVHKRELAPVGHHVGAFRCLEEIDGNGISGAHACVMPKILTGEALDPVVDNAAGSGDPFVALEKIAGRVLGLFGTFVEKSRR
jgi:hypothetical protein